MMSFLLSGFRENLTAEEIRSPNPFSTQEITAEENARVQAGANSAAARSGYDRALARVGQTAGYIGTTGAAAPGPRSERSDRGTTVRPTMDVSSTILTSTSTSESNGEFAIILASIGILSLFIFFMTWSILAVLVFIALVVLVIVILLQYGFITTSFLYPPAPETKTKNQQTVPSLPGAIFKASEVFHIADNKFTYDQAPAVCAAYGSQLATLEQILYAYNNGAEWCGYGWSQGGMALFPTQETTWKSLQGETDTSKRTACGRPGVNGGYFDPATKFGVNCFGFKPDGELDFPLPPPGTDRSVFNDMVKRFRSSMNSFTMDPYSRNEWSGYDPPVTMFKPPYGTQFSQNIGMLAGSQGPRGEQGHQGDRGEGRRGGRWSDWYSSMMGQTGGTGGTGTTEHLTNYNYANDNYVEDYPGTTSLSMADSLGPYGLVGPTGPRGYRGEKGDRGHTGPMGPAGLGPTGPRSSTGPATTTVPPTLPPVVPPVVPTVPPVVPTVTPPPVTTTNSGTQPSLVQGLTSGSSILAALTTLPPEQAATATATLTPTQQQALASSLGVTIGTSGKDADVLPSLVASRLTDAAQTSPSQAARAARAESQTAAEAAMQASASQAIAAAQAASAAAAAAEAQSKDEAPDDSYNYNY